ncbi:GNAT family N-acetyltransferase [Actinotalea sp. K2]|uniref:GNAT family N-acetyltransferase n=1 Tax=Actinotalea sp. K2 TaxID=2939438 RepID=UPI002017DC98|nr:GNAT family protein [Actinotalea sp. K2]MCL3861788.1 GNAT family N-acetyltransferase [Actinotalea sp. K2]
MLTMPTVAPTCGDVRLRSFEARDTGMVRDLSTDPYVPLTGTLVGHATQEQALEWIGRQHDRLANGAGYSFCIAAADDDRALGQVGLWLADHAHGRATVGYGVAPSERGRGVATRALTAVTSFAWSVPGLHRVELSIEPWNVASSRAAEKAGYQCEGLLRSHQVIGGARVDMLLWSALRPLG